MIATYQPHYPTFISRAHNPVGKVYNIGLFNGIELSPTVKTQFPETFIQPKTNTTFTCYLVFKFSIQQLSVSELLVNLSSSNMVWFGDESFILVELMIVKFGIVSVVTIIVEASIGSHEYALNSFKPNTTVDVESRTKPTQMPVIGVSQLKSPSRSIFERQALFSKGLEFVPTLIDELNCLAVSQSSLIMYKTALIVAVYAS